MHLGQQCLGTRDIQLEMPYKGVIFTGGVRGGKSSALS